MTVQWALVLMLAAVAVDAFAGEVATVAPGWSSTSIIAFFLGLGGLVTVIGGVAVKIIVALREAGVALAETKRIVVAGQIAAVAANVVSAEKQQEIHLLVNSQSLAQKRSTLVLLRREYERTNKDADREAVALAEVDLRDAEASSLTVARVQADHAQDNRDSAARAELEAGQARAGIAPDAAARWVLALEQIVALTKESSERTKSTADATLYQQARDNLALAQKMN